MSAPSTVRRGFFAARGRLAVPAAALAAWLAAAGLAAAVTPEVKDEAGFFSADAVTRANEVFKDIRQRHKKDLLVETHLKPPTGREPGPTPRPASGSSPTGRSSAPAPPAWTACTS